MEHQAQTLDFSGRLVPDFSSVPRDVKVMVWSRVSHWFGWGFGETLYSVWLLGFAATLTEVGFIQSILEAVFLLSVPVVGYLADRFPSRTLLIAGMVLYPFIGIGLYVAGLTKWVALLLLVRAVNGVSYCLDVIGFDTYIRRMAPRRAIATNFGYNATFANLGWLIAALLGAYLVQYISINTLLLLIAPFSLLALIQRFRAGVDVPEKHHDRARRISFFAPFTTFLKEVIAMKRGLRGVVALMFCFDVAAVMASFFIPIEAFRDGASLSATAVLVVISTLPALSEFWLAEFIDGSRAKRRIALSIALVALPMLLMAAAFTASFFARIAIAFCVQTSAILGTLALQSYATMLSRRDRFGETASVLEGASTVGDLLAPIAIGVATDMLGFSLMYSFAAAAFALVAMYFSYRPIER